MKTIFAILLGAARKKFIKELRGVTEADVVFHLKDKKIPQTKEKMSASIRVVQFPLDSRISEILITNMLDNSLTVEDFKYLYHLRWGIEEKYDEIKIKLKIEAFSGVLRRYTNCGTAGLLCNYVPGKYGCICRDGLWIGD